MTKEITTIGMIIKETKVGEGNKIFTLLTADMGKIQASGAGVRSFKSKISSGCSLFCYSEFKLRRGKSRDIFNIVSAEKKMDFFNIRYDIVKLAFANYITDLANRVTVADSESGDILRLLLNTMYYVQKNEYDHKLKPVYELRLMAELGYAPEVNTCGLCGSKNNLTHFSVDNSCTECSICNKISNLYPDTLQAMRYILTVPVRNIYSFVADEKVLSQLQSISEKYLLQRLGTVPKSLLYLKSIQ